MRINSRFQHFRLKKITTNVANGANGANGAPATRLCTWDPMKPAAPVTNTFLSVAGATAMQKAKSGGSVENAKDIVDGIFVRLIVSCETLI